MHWYYWIEGGLVGALVLVLGWMAFREKTRK